MAARQRAVATLPTLMRALKTNNNNSTITKPPNTPLPSLRRAFSLYDQINLIDNVPQDQLRFQGYTDTGFTVTEILILGCGRYIQQVNPELRQFIRSTGMKLEAIDSKNAASTYNILNEEGRIVAAAILPYGVTS